MPKVNIAHEIEEITYPTANYNFSPDTVYPEYPWADIEIAKEKNEVYTLIRKCLYGFGCDRDNYGTKEWNPLGEYIKPGDFVLIKPNWVENKNKNSEVDDNLACLVTNPSVLRTLVDYVVIALRGEGKIILGDAPMQGCDLQDMFRITEYTKLFEFLDRQEINYEIADLRKYSVSGKYNGVLTKPMLTKESWGSCAVNLAQKSMHSEKDNQNPHYKVTDYKEEDTASYHHVNNHQYEINKIALEADVIINVPKPKTHRLAGMTAGCKNFVGITYEKACLPHRIEGDKESGGDAYLKKSKWKEWMHYFDEKRTSSAIAGKYKLSKLNDLIMKACYVMGAVTTGDKYRIGSWYGNDTIWRTSVDLNYALLYADKEGKLCNTVQRKIITIGDMIICGQGEGPVGPTPKPLGMIMMSDNNLLFDRVMCEIMGFSADKLPMFSHEKVLQNFGYANRKKLEEEMVYIDGIVVAMVKDFIGKNGWGFEPHSCWKGHIEK